MKGNWGDLRYRQRKVRNWRRENNFETRNQKNQLRIELKNTRYANEIACVSILKTAEIWYL